MSNRVSTIRLLAWLQRIFLKSNDFTLANSVISSIIKDDTTIGDDLYNKLIKYYNENSNKEENSFLNTTGNCLYIKDVVGNEVSTVTMGSILLITVNASHGDHIDRVPVILLADV